MDVALCEPFDSHNAGREMLWDFGPVNEFEAQFSLVGVLRLRKKAKFSWLQNALLTVRS
jgi:hypothetical protein